MLSRRFACLVAVLPAALFAHSDFPLPLRDVPVAALPSAPLGQGKWRFEVESGWAKLPEGKGFTSTHGGVAVDKAGNVYMSSDGPDGVFVFDPTGKFLRTVGAGLGNLHGLMLREEGGREYLYGALNNAAKAVKLSLDGKVLWELGVPTESGIYASPADAKKKGAVNFRPTGIAVAPDGRIYVADGYGASVIHVYDAKQKYLKTIGSRGEGEGQFRTCHGIALDTRYGAPRLLVADRENRRLVHLDLEGKWLGVLTTGLRRPCAISISGDFAAVAELEGRAVVTDKAGTVVATLGDNPDKEQWAKFRLAPELWQDGIFIAPHGLSFDAKGNLYIQDWNFVGRLTKLRRSPVTATAMR